MSRKKRTAKPVAPPTPPKRPADSCIRVMLYDAKEVVELPINTLDDLKKIRAEQKERILWVDVDGPMGQTVMSALGEMFKLHALALEDVVHTNQRAKFEEYADHFFAISRMVKVTDHSVDSEQLSMFVGKGFVVTFQEKPGGDCLGSVRERIRKGNGKIRELGADHLAYALLDAVIDAYFPVLDDQEEVLEELEDELDTNFNRAPNPTITRRIHTIRRNILKLRRMAMPMRDAVFAVSRNIKGVTDETRIHLRDCYDHMIRIIDLLETHRDSCIGLRELYQARLANHTNEVMKVLAIITTVFTPLTFIAGIYGMNFNPEKSPYNMPELNWLYGYPFALGLMVLVFFGLVYFLYRRGWLTRAVITDDRDEEVLDRDRDT